MNNKYADPVTWIGFLVSLVLFGILSLAVGAVTGMVVGYYTFGALFVLALLLLFAAP